MSVLFVSMVGIVVDGSWSYSIIIIIFLLRNWRKRKSTSPKEHIAKRQENHMRIEVMNLLYGMGIVAYQ